MEEAIFAPNGDCRTLWDYVKGRVMFGHFVSFRQLERYCTTYAKLWCHARTPPDQGRACQNDPSDIEKLFLLGARDIVQPFPHNTDNTLLFDAKLEANPGLKTMTQISKECSFNTSSLPFWHMPVSFLVWIIVPPSLQSARVEYAGYALLPIFRGNKNGRICYVTG